MRQLPLLELEPKDPPGLRVTPELRAVLIQMMSVAIQTVFRGPGGRDEDGQSTPEANAAASRS